MDNQYSMSSRQSTTPMRVGVLLALGLATILWWPPLVARLLPSNIVWRNLAAQGLDWLICLSLIAIVLLWERRPLSSLGFKRLTKDNLFGGLGLAGFCMLGLVAWNFLLGPFIPDYRIPTQATIEGSLPKYFFLWFAPISLLTASVAEEIIFRGYAMERLLLLTNKKWVAAALPHIAFALYHLKDGIAKVIMLLVLGLLFTIPYLRTRDLTMLIMAHFFIDLFAVIGHAVNG